MVGSLPRWSISGPPSAKPAPGEGGMGRVYMPREGARHTDRNYRLKINPEMNLQQCGDAAEIV